MKNKGLIITNGYKIWPPIKHMCNRLIESFVSFGITVEIKTTTEIYVEINNDGELEVKNLHYDFIIFLDKDIYLANILEKLGYKVFNKAKSIEICDDKIKTFIALSNKGINMPKTIVSPLNYSEIIDEHFLKHVSVELGYPLVAKINYGSQGTNVTLINNFDELMNIESLWKNIPHHYEELIQDSLGVDYRLILINHKCVACMKRTNKNGDFRSNLAVGGTASNVKLPKNFISTAENISKILHLDYCGVDLLSKNSTPVLCEVNSNAFIQGIEKITGIDIAIKYAEHIIRTIY